MAECAAEVTQAASDVDRTVRGTVRVSAAPGMAHAFLAPCAAYVRAKLPGVRLEVSATTRYVDLVRREADLAIRWQSTARRDQARELEVLCEAVHPIAAFATPAYIAALPARYVLADLDWIGWCPPFEQLAPNPQLAAAIPGFAPAFGADDYLVQLRAAESGAGAIVLAQQRYRLAPPSPLVALALDLGAPPQRTHLVAARASLTIPRVRAVADVLAAELASTVVSTVTTAAPARRSPPRRSRTATREA